MGSFNVACSISSLTIHPGDRAGLMFIRRQPSYGPVKALTSRVYNTDDFLPYLPPVYGVYDDYGSLTELEASATTEAIEAIFARPALAVVNAIGHDRGIYDHFNPICELYLPSESFELLKRYNVSDEETLLAFGFERVEPGDGYVDAWRFKNWRIQSQKSEAFKEVPRDFFTWTVEDAATGGVLVDNILAANGIELVLSTFAKATGAYPGFPEEDWARIERLQSMSGSFFLKEVYEELKPLAAKDEFGGDWLKDTEEKLKEILAVIMVYRKGTELFPGESLESYLAHTHFHRSLALKTEWEFWELRSYLAGEELRDALTYPVVLQLCNRMLQPSYNGEQFGNDASARKLLSISDEILKRRAGAQEEEDE